MPGSRNSNKTILIVDDEDNDLRRSCDIVEVEGYTVFEADCYSGAITVVEENPGTLDLLVADLSLPDGDSCDLAIRLRERLPNLRVLFVSGKAGAEVCRFYGLDQ